MSQNMTFHSIQIYTSNSSNQLRILLKKSFHTGKNQSKTLRNLSKYRNNFKKMNLLVANGPHRASFLNVQYLATSSKCNPDGHVFKYGYPSTHYIRQIKTGKWKEKHTRTKFIKKDTTITILRWILLQKVNKNVNQLIKSHYNLNSCWFNESTPHTKAPPTTMISSTFVYGRCVFKTRRGKTREMKFHRWENVKKSCQKKRHLYEVHCSVDYNMQTNMKKKPELTILSLDFFYCLSHSLVLTWTMENALAWTS